MTGSIRHSSSSRVAWELVRRQHGVVTRRQLERLGFSRHAIRHRIKSGRLHPVRRGVYAVGRPDLTPYGRWMAAVLSCGTGAVLSHSSAAALFRIGPERSGSIEVSLCGLSHREPEGLVVHRRRSLSTADTGTYEGIPTTSPVQTMIDLTPRNGRVGIERMVNEADKYDLVHPPELRRELAGRAGEPGVAKLHHLLDRRTFRLSRSELERCFMPFARRVGLPVPRTRQVVNGFEVDFHWPALRFLVETDGLRFHRTPAEQARDRLRDQAHTAAGYTHLRFTHEQVRYEPEHVRAVLASTAGRLGVATPAA